MNIIRTADDVMNLKEAGNHDHRPYGKPFTIFNFSALKTSNNRLRSGELISNNRRAVDFVSSKARLSEATFSLIRLRNF